MALATREARSAIWRSAEWPAIAARRPGCVRRSAARRSPGTVHPVRNAGPSDGRAQKHIAAVGRPLTRTSSQRRSSDNANSWAMKRQFSFEHSRSQFAPKALSRSQRMRCFGFVSASALVLRCLFALSAAEPAAVGRSPGSGSLAVSPLVFGSSRKLFLPAESDNLRSPKRKSLRRRTLAALAMLRWRNRARLSVIHQSDRAAKRIII